MIIAGCDEDRDAARFNAVRSRVSSRSHSASDPRAPIIIRPAAVEESIPSVSDTSDTPRSLRALTVSNICNMFRPSRSVDGKQRVPRHVEVLEHVAQDAPALRPQRRDALHDGTGGAVCLRGMGEPW